MSEIQPIIFKKVEIRKPRYDPHPEKSKTNNSAWRQGLFVVFEDYHGNTFDWMPRWDQLLAINEAREDVEEKNRVLARLHQEAKE